MQRSRIVEETFGNGAGQIAEGSDSRLAEVRFSQCVRCSPSLLIHAAANGFWRWQRRTLRSCLLVKRQVRMRIGRENHSLAPRASSWTKSLRACGLKREEIYICNILRCRPLLETATLIHKKLLTVASFLTAKSRIVSPKYIICWGTVAAQNLMGENTTGRSATRDSFCNTETLK